MSRVEPPSLSDVTCSSREMRSSAASVIWPSASRPGMFFSFNEPMTVSQSRAVSVCCSEPFSSMLKSFTGFAMIVRPAGTPFMYSTRACQFSKPFARAKKSCTSERKISTLPRLSSTFAASPTSSPAGVFRRRAASRRHPPDR